MGIYEKTKYKIPGGGVILPWSILNSKAYKELTPSSAKALPFFLGKVKFGKNTGIKYDSPQYYEYEFRYPYAEGKRQGFALATFSNIIQEVIRKGFVDPVYRGGMKGDGLGYSWFKLSPRWKKFGESDFEPIEWRTLIPKPRNKRKGYAYPFHSTEDLQKPYSISKSEINNSNFRNKDALCKVSISENEVVEIKNT